MPESANIPSSNLLIHVSGEAELREGASSEAPSVLSGCGPKLFARDDSPVEVGCGRIHTIPKVSQRTGKVMMKPIPCRLDMTLSPALLGFCKDCRPLWQAMNPVTATEEKRWNDDNIF